MSADTIGRAVWLERERANMTRLELAKKLDISAYSVKNLEIGTRKISAMELYKISKIFKKSMLYFIGVADD